jgi:hypothetical protein
MNRRERRKQQIARQRAASAKSPVSVTAGTTPVPAAGEHSAILAESEAIATGPRSDEGKAISSRNAVKHNLCSTRLTGADSEELTAIRAKLEYEWEPATETERMLLAQMALSQWRMDRALSLELAAFNNESLDPALLALTLRYRTAAERSFYKALAELQRLRTSIREDARRALRDEEEELNREIERFVSTPLAPPPAFVSQTGSSPAHPAQFVSQNTPSFGFPPPDAPISEAQNAR